MKTYYYGKKDMTARTVVVQQLSCYATTDSIFFSVREI